MHILQSEQSKRNSAWYLGLAAGLTAAAISSCGGGGASIVPPPPGPGGPAAGTANISGQLVEGAGGRITSAVGDSLSGVLVQLINTASGQLAGSDTTDLLGKYEFKGVPSGQNYLLKVEFTASRDLNGDGVNDSVELTLPLNPADQATLSLLNQLGIVDSNNDGQLDAIRFENEINDDKGGLRERDSEHRFEDGQTVVDDNSNGSFDDDSAFDDSDCDGLPDDKGSGGGGSDDSPSEKELHGSIEAISADSISVLGVSFQLTTATRFMGDDNEPLGPESFTVGTYVEVEGFLGSSGLIAYKVKLDDDGGSDDNGGDDNGGDDNGGDDNGGDDSQHFSLQGMIASLSAELLSVGNKSFVLNDSTQWLDDNNNPLSAADFAAGMSVEVEFISDGQGGYVAVKVKLDDNGNSDNNPGDELEKIGQIEQLTSETIVVGGISFKLTEATIWRIDNDETRGPEDFSVGMLVEVTGDSDGKGGWIARRVKTEA